MTEGPGKNEVTHGSGQIDENVRKFVGSRSTEWTSKLSQVKGQVRKKIGEPRDTRRFADGRTR